MLSKRIYSNVIRAKPIFWSDYERTYDFNGSWTFGKKQ